jgi:KaiC/GvpD/RAD55 family RecA-like ATPase
MDDQTLGWWPEDLILFVGRLGVGKTWTLVICAHAAWRAGKRVLLVSTEMSTVQMARRFYALHLRMPYNDIRRGRLGDFAEPRFLDGIREIMDDSGIDIVGGDFDYTIDNVAAVVEDEKPDIVMIDGPYLIKNSGKNRHERVSNNFDDFKKIGKRNKIPIITNLQFNRSAKTGQDSTISAENIGVTDVAGWNCDAAYGLVQTDEMLANWQMGMKGLKVREGRPGTFRINWNHDSMNFAEIEGEGEQGPDGTGSAPVSAAPLADDGYEDVPF